MLEGHTQQLAELLTMHFWGQVISIPEEQEAWQGVRWVWRLQESSEWVTLRNGGGENGHGVMLREGFALGAVRGSCAVKGDFGWWKPLRRRQAADVNPKPATCRGCVKRIKGSRESKGQKDPGVTEAAVLGSRRWDPGEWDLPPLCCCLSTMCPCPLPLLGSADPQWSRAQAFMQLPKVLEELSHDYVPSSHILDRLLMLGAGAGGGVWTTQEGTEVLHGFGSLEGPDDWGFITASKETRPWSLPRDVSDGQ